MPKVLERKSVNLALQGGGAHGAFTWGVLARLLEDGRLRLAGLSGTSAGAMNAVALAAGYVEAGADGARAALERFWHEVRTAALLSLYKENDQIPTAAFVMPPELCARRATQAKLQNHGLG